MTLSEVPEAGFNAVQGTPELDASVQALGEMLQLGSLIYDCPQ
jgi:hypothetical protein